MRLIVDNKPEPPATVAQLAVHNFSAVKFFRDMTKDQRIKKVHSKVAHVTPMAVLASQIVALDKDELIATVRESYDEFGPCLMALANAGESAELLVGIIRDAEARLAVALAVIEGDH